MRVLVLGGCGFIGRHTVRALLDKGHDVVIGTRFPWRRTRVANHAVTLREVKLHHLLESWNWEPLLAGIDVVVNCVGILRPRPSESYRVIHELAPMALGRACMALGIRLVHVSALGLSAHAASGFCRSKHAGEQALLALTTKGGLKVTVVRPSLLDGEDGFGARWLRAVARWPVLFAPANPNGRIAPLRVEALASALEVLATERAGTMPPVVELGGAIHADIGEYLQSLRAQIGLNPAPMIRVPAMLVRCVSHLCDLLHFSPLSFGHVELMRRDNVPGVNSLVKLLAMAPRSETKAVLNGSVNVAR